MASCSKWFCKRGAGGGEIRTKDMLLLWGSAKKYAYQLAYGAKLPTLTQFATLSSRPVEPKN